ncbi:MAG: hypothetical protein CR971_00105 [candidate division SR1 bacterium]|nr:MAG: hypothetical protein CR971_00105 [candidate division SR1 bacterium]
MKNLEDLQDTENKLLKYTPISINKEGEIPFFDYKFCYIYLLSGKTKNEKNMSIYSIYVVYILF